MAKTELDARSHPPIDAILRSLNERPNVESSLILSRKDGSIIKANGFLSVEKRRRAESMVAYKSQSNEDTQRASVIDTEQHQTLTLSLSPAEDLATSIFRFVQIAGSLGSTLSTISADQAAEEFASRRSDPKQKVGEAEETRAMVEDESQVQLLRLRIKHREIIIFPDPQYLCCVVQRIGKQAGIDGR